MKAPLENTQESQKDTVQRVQQGPSTGKGGEATFDDLRDKQIVFFKGIGSRRHIMKLQREEEEKSWMEKKLKLSGFLGGVQEMNDIYLYLKNNSISIEDFIDLFKTGADFKEIKAVLKIEPDVAKVKKLMQESDGAINLEDILFTSMEDGKMGSIYFSNGRIRLLHDDGPAVEIHHKVERFETRKEHEKDLKYLKGKKGEKEKPDYHYFYNKLKKECSLLSSENQPKGDNILVEFVTNKRGVNYHPSRGTAQPFNIEGFKQHHLNILYNIANELSKKIKGLEQTTEKVKAQKYHLRIIEENISEFDGDIDLNSNEQNDLRKLHIEKKKEEEKLKALPTEEELKNKKKETIVHYNNLLKKWVNSHPVLKKITLKENIDSAD